MVFRVPAVVVSSIVACRSFVSLANFRQKVHVYSAAPYASQRMGSSGGSHGGNGSQARPGGGGPANNKRGIGNTVGGISLRSMGPGIDSVSEAYCMDVLDRTRTTGVLAAADSKRRYDRGDANENGGVMVHMETRVQAHDDTQSEDDVDLEKAESFGHGHRKKSFVPKV